MTFIRTWISEQLMNVNNANANAKANKCNECKMTVHKLRVTIVQRT